MLCNNKRRVEERTKFITVSRNGSTGLSTTFAGMLGELRLTVMMFFPSQSIWMFGLQQLQFAEQFSFTYTVSMPTFVHEIKYIMLQDLQG